MSHRWRLASWLTANLVRPRGPAGAGAIYLSFDDGPHPVHTDALLRVLAEHEAKASFYLTGKQAERHPQLVKRLLAEGHSIGNHSMNHPRMRKLGMGLQIAEIDQADAVLARFDGRHRHSFRPPYGRVTWPVLLSALWRRQPLVLWSVDSLDYRLEAEAVVQRLRAVPPRAGDIILFHDDGPCAAQALKVLLPEWKQAGLCFLALS